VHSRQQHALIFITVRAQEIRR